MLRERVSEDIFIFTSEMYAQVTAGAVLNPDGAVLIDTLAFPAETLEIKDFIENKLGARVRYLVNTHYHADHANGNCFFPDAEIIAHRLCRERLDTIGRAGLAQAKPQNPDLANVEIALPTTLLTDGALFLHLGKKTIQLFHTPGHSPDGLSVLLREDRILFAGDMMMPLPHIPDGDLDALSNSMQGIPALGLENVVQGHGEVVLRGEVDDAVRSNVRYLDTLRKKVEQFIRRGKPREALREIDIESCGKTRIPLNGLVVQLHAANVMALYDRMVDGASPAVARERLNAAKARPSKAAKRRTAAKKKTAAKAARKPKAAKKKAAARKPAAKAARQPKAAKKKAARKPARKPKAVKKKAAARKPARSSRPAAVPAGKKKAARKSSARKAPRKPARKKAGSRKSKSKR